MFRMFMCGAVSEVQINFFLDREVAKNKILSIICVRIGYNHNNLSCRVVCCHAGETANKLIAKVGGAFELARSPSLRHLFWWNDRGCLHHHEYDF